MLQFLSTSESALMLAILECVVDFPIVLDVDLLLSISLIEEPKKSHFTHPPTKKPSQPDDCEGRWHTQEELDPPSKDEENPFGLSVKG